MLKTCATCSYIGDDTEHVCPFCKADLAFGKPRKSARSGRIAHRAAGSRQSMHLGVNICLYKKDESSSLDTGTPHVSIPKQLH